MSLVRHNRGRTPLEDLITSAILGGIAYMPSDWATQALQAMFSDTDHQLKDPMPWPKPSEATSAQTTLWPRQGIEPDALFTVEGDQGTFRILVEVKWGADFSPDQALRQWEVFGTENTWHVLLVRNFADGTRHADACREKRTDKLWPRRVMVIGWDQVMQRLTEFQRSRSRGDPLGLWASDAALTLERFGIRRFGGFRQGVFTTHDASLSALSGKLFFKDAGCFRWPTASLPPHTPWKIGDLTASQKQS